MQQKEKEMKYMQIRKEDKMSLFSKNAIIYVENLEESEGKNFLETKAKVTGNSANNINLITFPYTKTKYAAL